MDQWTRLDPIYDSAAAARAIAAAAPARADAQDHDHGFPQDDIADLARLGLLAAPVPARSGKRLSRVSIRRRRRSYSASEISGASS